jgi:SAM-dependent methyltransferase
MKPMLSLFTTPDFALLSLAPGLKARVPARYRRAARHAFLRASSLVNAGSGVECPVCDRRFRKFARFHGKSDQCPGCSSLMRHRAILLYIQDVLKLAERELNVLHVGPAESLRRRLSSFDSIDYLSVDLDPAMADVQADVTDLQFDANSFDFVLCLHVLEHVPEDRKAISELCRVLRPGGTALIQVPPSDLEVTAEDPSVTGPRERERLFGQYDHVRLCGGDYKARLEEPGFEVEVVDYPAQLEQSVRARFGLRVGEPFYICVKPPAA